MSGRQPVANLVASFGTKQNRNRNATDFLLMTCNGKYNITVQT